MGNARRRVVGVLCGVAVVATTTVGAAGAGQAQASGCSGAGPAVTDFRGNGYSTVNCHVYMTGQTLQPYAASPGETSGVLHAGTNWFVCQEEAKGIENPAVGTARNDWWLYTQADTGSLDHAWGWFPATMVSGGGNYQPIPGLRVC